MTDFLQNCPPCLIAGTLLVIINFPLGWIGLVWFVHLAKKTNNMFFYYLGILVYALSWILLFCGIFLCGKDYAKAVYLKFQVPLFALTAASVISILIFNIYFAKKPSKINEKSV